MLSIPSQIISDCLVRSLAVTVSLFHETIWAHQWPSQTRQCKFVIDEVSRSIYYYISMLEGEGSPCAMKKKVIACYI